MAILYEINLWLGSMYSAYGGDRPRDDKKLEQGRVENFSAKNLPRLSKKMMEDSHE